ncbi:unnamed protein product [Echinostoma caproni]|uniref:Transmembrane protein 9 n=1 Tax=Echinostoma caproni TaxID=27848 RepID=A0A183AM16_9TREM|nr:unnamed protein product [Echinostoma caproni]
MHVSIILIWLCLCGSIKGAYEDARCKCIGFDRASDPNGTVPTKKIYVKAVPADKCTCKNILGSEDALFPNCECTYQVRNTTTIKVVVCLILVVISTLTLYMIFLLLLEPLLSARRAGRGHILASGSTDSGMSSEFGSSGRGPVAGIVSSSLGRFTRARIPDLNLKRSWTHSNAPGIGLPKATGMAVIWGRSRLNAEQLLDTGKTSGWFFAYLAIFLYTFLLRTVPVESRLRQRVMKPDTLVSTDCHSTVPPTVNVHNVVTRVKDQQQRWKGNVEAQRARVFSERSLLN